MDEDEVTCSKGQSRTPTTNLSSCHSNRFVALLCRQKFNLHVAASRLEIKIRSHKNALSRIRCQLHAKRIHIRDCSFELDHCRAYCAIAIHGNDLQSESAQSRQRQVHR